MVRNWDDLPEQIRVAEVEPYYQILSRKKSTLLVKRIFDLVASLILLLLLFIPMLVISIMIKCDSPGPVFFRQERVTANGKIFRIHKFRTMTVDAEKTGSRISQEEDSRITEIGKKLRRKRLDEIPQLIDILQGNMTFVGTRPEVVYYVEKYQPEYYATLLLPAGITSEASLEFRDEGRLLSESDDIDRVYLEEILPRKMELNLKGIREISVFYDLGIMIRTVKAVLLS